MRIETCWFCSSNIYPGHGVVFVRNDAKIFRFCRSKCHKHFKAKHNPRKMKWTKAYRKTAGKEMVVDSTFDFEKQRNVPVRYDRDLFVKTIQAMKKVDAIKTARKARFYRQRRMAAYTRHKSVAEREIENNSHLLEGLKQPLLHSLKEGATEMMVDWESSENTQKIAALETVQNDDVVMK
ncbi:ribosomal protein RPL24e [Cardiosporidium cionae]|uniref:Ribosomal protein RPL24e n=1 Tax=Cardiosporidium cionae TaxID=476202 RepID=A0ABQ7JEG9_9APIC|nr:ribosomal protein RPL24e [Cardiosporidium cionae]|eukprot:KAF8822407.1 ribosomal protein RPL24e [Cardiosporidium cionae]